MRKSNIFKGTYLFHFHTRLTDGELSIEDYFVYAAKRGIDRLIFLEHIRRQPTYDVEQFASELKQTSEKFRIEAVLGFEAKLLPGGDLDLSPEHLALADVIGIAEHRFPGDPMLLHDSLCRALRQYRHVDAPKTFVWVHPGLTFRKIGLNPTESPLYKAMVRWACQEQLLLEHNLRYKLVPESTLKTLDKDRVVCGADAHSMNDLERWNDTYLCDLKGATI